MLRRHRDDFLFSFTRGDSGKARMHFPPVEGFTNDSIDTLAGVAVYVNKEPPQWDSERYFLHFGDGVEIKGMPYAHGQLRGGTRVYLDGRLVAFVKRNTLCESAVAAEHRADGEVRYPLIDYLRSLGVNAGKARALELIDQDRVVARLSGRELAARRDGLRFAAPPHSQGSVVVHYGSGDAPADTSVSAIALYSPARAAAHFRR